MKIFVLFYRDHDGGEVLGAYSTYSLAEEAQSKVIARFKYYPSYFQIQEVKLDYDEY